MKKLKLTVLFIIFTVFCVFCQGCFLQYKYKGERVDLYTVAVNNIFKASGYLSNGEVVYDPIIEIIEEDRYGRVMFYYYEGCGYYDKEHMYESAYFNDSYTILVMQKKTDSYVYFYEDYCYESYKKEDKKFLKDGVFDYTKSNFSELKELNDWNKEIHEEKCTKKPLTTRNKGKLNVSEGTFENIISNYAKNTGYKGDDNIYRYDIYNTSDTYGRELYYVWGVGRDVYGEGVSPTSKSQYYEFAIIFNPDGSYTEDTCIIELQDTINCKNQIISFKQLNQWNEPYIFN
jgi:hypothetical protein